MSASRPRDRRGEAKQRLAIVGGGPIGIEAALYGLAAGYQVRLYESGPIAAGVASWGHVRMFTTWQRNTTPLGRRLLDEHGLDPLEPNEVPTGEELVHLYLMPLTSSPRLAGRICTDTKVVSISRESQLKSSNIGSPDDRGTTPFRLLLHDGAQPRLEHADIVIDASGTYGNPCGFGAGGMDPLHTPLHSAQIDRVLNDVTGVARSRYADRHVLLVGSGYSAATQAVALAQLGESARSTRCTWVTSSDRGAPIFEIPDDPLPGRHKLSREANRLAADPMSIITHIPSAHISSLSQNSRGKLNIDLAHGDASLSTVVDVDIVMALVGYRPDLHIDRELQVHRCYATEGTMRLAARLLEQSTGDCLALGSHGADALRNPEPDFFCIGAKSYGRNSLFLLSTGHEQVRDVFQLITGDSSFDLYDEH